MKKTLLFLLAALVSVGLQAQDEQDAARLMNPDIQGSSRYVSMGGAFTALGGDVTAIKDNPAALGVFRKTDFSVSFAVPTSVSDVSWNGEKQKKETKTSFIGNNVGVALNFGTRRTSGLISHTLGFNYQRVKNFNRTLYMGGNDLSSSITDLYANVAQSDGYSTDKTLLSNSAYDDPNQAWSSVLSHDAYLINYDSAQKSFSSLLGQGEKVNSRYYMRERGYIDEYDIAWGCNISNIAYLGAGLNIQNLHYRLDDNYQEAFGQGGGLNANNVVLTNGTGISANIGAIVAPVDWLRLGASIRTPTAWDLKEENSGDVTSTTKYTNNKFYSTPTNALSYRLHQPFRFNAGVAFVIGDWAVLSGEYEYNRFSKAKYKVSGDPQAYADANSNMPHANRDVFTVKAGAEVRPCDWLYLRGGYDYVSAQTPEKYVHEVRYNTVRTDSEWSEFKGAHYASAGVGFRFAWCYLDLAYQYRCAKENYYAYSNVAYGPAGKFASANPVSAAESKAIRHTATATFGIRF